MNPIFKKLNFKNHKQIHIVNSPDSFLKAVQEMSDQADISMTLTGAKRIEFLVAFVTKQKEVDDLAKKIGTLAGEDAAIWFSYPKGTSKKYTCEFNRDNGWKELGKLGYEPVRMVAIDEDWSALRFRKADYIKTMKRSSAISDKGKKRIAAVKKSTLKKSSVKKK